MKKEPPGYEMLHRQTQVHSNIFRNILHDKKTQILGFKARAVAAITPLHLHNFFFCTELPLLVGFDGVVTACPRACNMCFE